MREAQEVVAHADSLREAHLYAQNEYDDSLSLAQAYSTLSDWQCVFPDDYAHACYHYGRLLRAKDNHVEAMKVFIDATHSRTRDFHILGRVYSNMGSMCHLASEYQLSYDMFAKCADCFLQKGDTISYYYGLNDMAFELAEQGKKEETLALLENIEEKCTNTDVISLANLTKTVLYEKIRQHDSVIYYANHLSATGKETATSAITKAQAFYHLQKYDSALYYAHLTLKLSSSLFDKDNAYYILIHCDSIFGGTDVYTLSSIRADNEKEIEIRHGKLSTAVQLLEQDLTRKPDLRWLYSTIGTLVLISFGLFFYVRKKHRKRELLSQQIEELENRNNNTIAQISAQIENNIALLSQSANLKEDLSWSDYNKLCRIVDLQFNLLATKLHKKQVLNETQIRLCVLVLLNLRRVDIADTLPYAQNGIGKLKDQTSKLLGTTGKNLRLFLIKIAIEE